MVLLADGNALVAPSHAELAAKVGLYAEPTRPYYDLAIIGAGPAGLACAVYGASEGLKVMLIEQNAPGGQAGTSSMIENYLGFPNGVSGADLARRAVTQAKRFGAELLIGQAVVGIRRVDPYKVVHLADGAEVACHALMLSVGNERPRAGRPGDRRAHRRWRVLRRGAFRGRDVSGAARVRPRRRELGRAGRVVLRALRRAGHDDRPQADSCCPRCRTTWWTRSRPHRTSPWWAIRRSRAVHGNGHLEAIDVRNAETGETRRLEGHALFIFIGTEPRTGAFCSLVATDEQGFILTGAEARAAGKGWSLDRDPLMFETSVPGIFAAGDVRASANRRIAAAVGEGSAAIFSIHQYLRSV